MASVPDFSQTCRFCARCETSSTTLQLQSLYNTPYEGINAKFTADILMETTPWLTISPDDELPKVTCKTCLDKLLQVQSFQQMCTNAEIKLLSLIKAADETCDMVLVKEELNIEEDINWSVSEMEIIEVDKPDEDVIAMQETLPEQPTTTSRLRASRSSAKRQTKIVKKNRFECTICPKTFGSRKDLNKHTKTHSEVKQFACDLCDKTFKNSFNLCYHKTHTHDAKQFKCEYCEREFPHKNSLVRHQRLHTGEKPYKCDYCEYVCSQQGHLITHLKVHLGLHVYSCDLCPDGFETNAERRKHYLTHKNEDKATREKNLAALKAKNKRLRKSFKNNERIPLNEPSSITTKL